MEFKELKDITKESGIIATVIYEPTFVFHSESLIYSHFYDKINGAVYWAVRKLVDNGIFEVDAFSIYNTVVSTEAKRLKISEVPLEHIEKLYELGKYVRRTDPEDYKMLVREVQDLSLRREMYLKLQVGQQACLNVENKNEDIQTRIYELIEEVNRNFASTKEIKTFGEKLPIIWKNIQERQDGKYISIPFKFQTLNEYVEIEPGELVLFGAYAKVGKSAMLLTNTVDLLKRGKTVLVIDSELSDKLYTMRMIAHVSGVRFKTVKDGTYTAEEKEKIDNAQAWLTSVNLYHEYMPIFNDCELMMMIKRVNAMHKIDVLVVDYFKINSNGTAYDVSNAMANTVDMIKNEVCGAMGIAGLGAVQCTKNGEVALSSGIIRNCSTLIVLVRKTDSEIAEDTIECGNTKAIVKINRNGSQHTEEEYIDMNFTGDLLDYSECKQHIKVQPY